MAQCLQHLSDLAQFAGRWGGCWVQQWAGLQLQHSSVLSAGGGFSWSGVALGFFFLTGV